MLYKLFSITNEMSLEAVKKSLCPRAPAVLMGTVLIPSVRCFGVPGHCRRWEGVGRARAMCSRKQSQCWLRLDAYK